MFIGTPRHASPISRGEIHIWNISVLDLVSSESELSKLLDATEREQANRFAIERERARYRVFRGSMRSILASYFACGPDELSITAGDRGKPVLSFAEGRRAPEAADRGASDAGGPFAGVERPNAGEPRLRDDRRRLPSNLSFNLSHSHDIGMLAVADGMEVGADVERIRMPRDLDILVGHFFRPEEAEYVLAASAEARAEAFCRLWTRKEAVVKCMGGSLPEWIAEVPALVSSPGTPIELPGAGAWFLRDIPAPQGHLAAVCATAPVTNVRVFDFVAESAQRGVSAASRRTR